LAIVPDVDGHVSVCFHPDLTAIPGRRNDLEGSNVRVSETSEKLEVVPTRPPFDIGS
jgi:hypothetical protein